MVYLGFTYEIQAQTQLTFVTTGHGDLSFITVDWSGDYESIDYIRPVGETKTQLDLLLSKSLLLSDSFSQITCDVTALATDYYYAPHEIQASDSGTCVWNIDEEVLEKNEPDIVPDEYGSILEGGAGEITRGTLFVRFPNEPPYGSPLSFSFKTRDGSAQAGVHYVAKQGVASVPVGAREVAIEFEAIGNDIVTGLLDFYVDFYGQSHGQFLRTESRVIIQDSDVLPCGANTSAGGPGVAYYRVNTGSEPVVFKAYWQMYSAPDRMDVYANGQHRAGSNTDIDNHLGGSQPTYDRAAYDAIFGGSDGQATIDLVQKKWDRGGCGVAICTLYPLELGDPMMVDVRHEGLVSGTGWDGGMMCEPAKDVSGGYIEVDNSIDQRWNAAEIFNCNGNLPWGTKTKYRISFQNPGTELFDKNTKPPYSWYNHEGWTWQSGAIQSGTANVSFWRGRTKIHEQNVVAGGSLTFEFEQDVGRDFQYIEMQVIYDTSALGSTYMTGKYDNRGNSYPPRYHWRAQVQRI